MEMELLTLSRCEDHGGRKTEMANGEHQVSHSPEGRFTTAYTCA